MSKDKQQIPPAHGLVSMDRREVLKLCAQAAAVTGAATLLPGCAEGPGVAPEPSFDPVGPELIEKGAQQIADALTSFVSRAISNDAATNKIGELLSEIGIVDSSLHGALSDVEHFGHGLLISGGGKGFMNIEIHNDKAYVEPLIIRKGQPPVPRAYGWGACTLTKYCTATLMPKDKCDNTDEGAEDPPTGLLPRFVYQARDGLKGEETQLFGQVIGKAAQLLAKGGGESLADLSQWLDKQAAGLPETRAYVGVTVKGDTTWFDWMLLFSNGASAIVQVAAGPAVPAHALGDAHLDPDKVDIAFDEVQTNVAEQPITFAHVTMRP